jgi:hypothetical protein
MMRSPYFVSTTNAGTVDLWFQSATNPATFNTSTTLSSYGRIGSATAWTPGTLGAVGFNASPDMSSDFTTLIQTSGWASGNAVSVITEGQGVTGNTSNIYMYDQSSSDGAELNVTYTATSTTGLPNPVVPFQGKVSSGYASLFGTKKPMTMFVR